MAKTTSSVVNGSGGAPTQSVTTEERGRMIAEAAYYRALRRGFNGGDPVDDWLDAEQEIDRALMIPAWQKRESAAHEASERHAPPMRPQSSHQRRQFRDSK